MNCSSLQLKVFATILFICANAMNQANAQTSAPATEDTILLPTPRTSGPAIPHLEPGQKLIIITSKDPTVKRTCNLDSASADEIHCYQHSKTQPAIYRRADLEAIIEAGTSRFAWLGLLVPFAIGGSIIWGACLLGALSAFAIIGAVPIGIIGVFFVLISTVWVVGDYKSATVLYQKPGTTLAVKLN